MIQVIILRDKDRKEKGIETKQVMLAMQNTDRISYVLLFLYWSLNMANSDRDSLQTIDFEGSVSMSDGGQFSFPFSRIP